MSRTLWVVLAFLVGLLGYDLWTIVKHGYETTVSAVVLDMSQNYPVIPLLIGIAAGHLWWPNEHACKRLAERQKKAGE